MKIYGSSHNLTLFKKYGLSLLEEAKVDYIKALPDVEIYLGKVFTAEYAQKREKQIFDLEIDNCLYYQGEEAVGEHIRSYLIPTLGYVIQRKYFPICQAPWYELERLINQELDYKTYYCRKEKKRLCPAVEVSADLFQAAIYGHKEFIYKWVKEAEEEYVQELKEKVLNPITFAQKKVSINYHAVRRWFYNLWGQNYEWGSFTIGGRTAEADGYLYSFTVLPKMIEQRSMVSVGELLEAHGYKIKLNHKLKKVEYWR